MTDKQAAGLPSLVGMNHVGFGVRDLDAAVAFCQDVLGLELEQRIRIESPGDDKMTRWFDVAPGSVVKGAFLRLPDGSRMELVEWQSPEPTETTMPRNTDAAGRHVAISVTDLDAAVAYLKAQPGVRVMEAHPRGFAYFETPFGMYIQMVAVTKG